ncbi:MAG: DNA helicase [Planctomycetaceae bacterium]|nr:MAG: DNA helicase [Planctomycetaceae bacterium]
MQASYAVSVRSIDVNYLTSLNPAQHEAVTTLSGPLLVLAGAGTGKTRVITCRMAELVRRGIRPDKILSVTFTNKAACEMAERMQHMLGQRVRPRPYISTFHAFCVQVLRMEAEHLGYPSQFVIYDRGEQESVARRALRDIKVVNRVLSPSDLVQQISRWKSAGIRPEQASDIVEDDRQALAALAYRKYQMTLRASGAVDFDDLLLLTCQLFEEHPAVLKRQQQRFDHIQIDEYQDTNNLQFRIVAALVEPHHNLCVVGDDDQSIYAWRGADVQHILQFQRHFPEAKVIRLQDNYRCTQEIIAVANRLVRHNLTRHEKQLVAHKRGEPVAIRAWPHEQAEAEGVVGEIRSILESRRVPADQIAILFRTNEQPRLFESEFRRQRIPYVLVGGQSFYERREVRDILAYLKVIAYPDDEVSLLRILNVPPRGIGEATTEKLLTQSVRQGMSFWETVALACQQQQLPPKTLMALEQFRQLIETYRQRFLHEHTSLSRLLQDLLKAIGYQQEVERQYAQSSLLSSRLGVIDECISVLEEYERQADRPLLSEFLEQTSLAERDDFRGAEEVKGAGIRLMTLHSAKGLEFSHVYLVGWEEGILPHQRAIDLGTASAIEEERRLAYVGITRAREILSISWAQSRTKWGKSRPSIPSRFLYELQATS